MNGIYGLDAYVNPTQDISLVGYDPQLDYEEVNMDNYRRYSLMDKGPEEIYMPDEEFNQGFRTAMSKNRIDVRYNPREPVKKSNMDLNDYSVDFKMGEDEGTIQQAVTAMSLDRVKKFEYFKNDSAKQVPIGQVAPQQQRDAAYWSRLGALKLRQDFIVETKDTWVSNKYIGVPKSKIPYDPKKCPGMEKALNQYIYDTTADTKTMYVGKAKQMKALYGALKDLQFDQDSVTSYLRFLNNKKRAKSLGGADTKNDNNFGEETTETIRESFADIKNKRSKRTGDTMTDSEFTDAIKEVTRVANIISKQAAMNANKGRYSMAGFEGFDDTISMTVKKSNIARDKLNKIKNYLDDREEPEDALVQGIKKAAKESAKLSGFYHNTFATDSVGPNDDSLVTSRPMTFVTSEKNPGHKYFSTDGQGFDDSEIEKIKIKKLHKYDPKKIGAIVQGDNQFSESMQDCLRTIDPIIQAAKNNESTKLYARPNADSFIRTTNVGSFSRTGTHDRGMMEDSMRV